MFARDFFSCHLCKNVLCSDSHLQCKVHLIVLVWVLFLKKTLFLFLSVVVFFSFFLVCMSFLCVYASVLVSFISATTIIFSMHLTIFGGNFMTIFAAQITAHSVYYHCDLNRIYCWLFFLVHFVISHPPFDRLFFSRAVFFSVFQTILLF